MTIVNGNICTVFILCNVFLFVLDTELKSLSLLVVEEDVCEVELYPQQQVVGELACTRAVTKAQ